MYSVLQPRRSVAPHHDPADISQIPVIKHNPDATPTVKVPQQVAVNLSSQGVAMGEVGGLHGPCGGHPIPRGT